MSDMFGKSMRNSILLTALFFSIVFLFLKPLLYSTDDGYLLYTLSGGFGEAPNNLLHYDYGWHYWLGWVVESLFELNPDFNWYSGFLIILHAIGTCMILYVLFERFQGKYAILFSLVFMFLFEILLLLQLSYTNASLLLSLSVCTLLFHNYSSKELNLVRSWSLFILILIAGMLRFHTMLFVVALFLPLFLIYFFYKKPWKILTWFLVLGLSVFILNIFHRNYYINHIPEWKKAEAFRQSFFYMTNRPKQGPEEIQKIFRDSTELAFFQRLFFYDTSYLSEQRIGQLAKQMVRERKFEDKQDEEGLYWFFIEARLFIALFLIILLAMALGKQYKSLKILLIIFGWIAIVFAYLFIFQKITSAIYIAGFLCLFLQSALIFSDKADKIKPEWLIYVSLLLLIIFSTRKILRLNQANNNSFQRYLCYMEVLKKHPDNLFVATDFYFPIGRSGIWTTPKNYPASNLLYGGKFITGSQDPVLRRFGIKNLMKDVLTRNDVFFIGSDFPELNAYYKSKWNINTQLSEKLPGYGCAEVRQLKKP